jgi:hypothetical protein
MIEKRDGYGSTVPPEKSLDLGDTFPIQRIRESNIARFEVVFQSAHLFEFSTTQRGHRHFFVMMPETMKKIALLPHITPRHFIASISTK